MKRIQKPKPKKPRREEVPPARQDKRAADRVRRHIQEALDEIDKAIQDGD